MHCIKIIELFLSSVNIKETKNTTYLQTPAFDLSDLHTASSAADSQDTPAKAHRIIPCGKFQLFIVKKHFP